MRSSNFNQNTSKCDMKSLAKQIPHFFKSWGFLVIMHMLICFVYTIWKSISFCIDLCCLDQGLGMRWPQKTIQRPFKDYKQIFNSPEGRSTV